MICQCLPYQLFASADPVLATDKSRYFAQPRAIIVKCLACNGWQGIAREGCLQQGKVEKVGPAFLSFNPCPSLVISCNRLTEDVLIPEYNFLISKQDYFFGIQLIWSKVLAFKKVTNSVTLPVSNQISYETVLCVVTHDPSPQFRDHTEPWANIAEEQKWESQIK